MEGPELWTVEGQETNVRFRRAFHDKLGVNQVIFVFCDDLLKKVYELPWFEKWSSELDELLDNIGLRKHQVIRCLLAKLPVGVEIPVHHDTGLWATKSHRVHVPISTSPQDGPESNQVVFKCGYSDSTMERAAFCQGDVIELNNRAKHMVKNNWDRDRIHLILDYVDDEDALIRRVLASGQMVDQTRRAIYVDGESDDMPPSENIPQLDKKERSTRGVALMKQVMSHGVMSQQEFVQACRRFRDGECLEQEYLMMLQQAIGKENMIKAFFKLGLPLLLTDAERRLTLQRAFDEYIGPKSFLIIGAMKCGTTSLYDYLTQHPDVMSCRQKEPHFFDWKWDTVNAFQLDQRTQEKSAKLLMKIGLNPSNVTLQKFLTTFEIQNADSIIGEASPSYFVGGSTVAKRVASVLPPSTKLVVILRDPVARAWSHFQMTKDVDCTPGQRARRGEVAGKSFKELLMEDLDLIRQADETIVSNPKMCDLATFQTEYLDKLPQGHGSHSYFGRGMYALQLQQWFSVFPIDSFYFIRLDSLSKSVQGEMSKLFASLRLSEFTLQDEQPKNTRSYESMDDETKAWLQKLYQPHNEYLAEILGDQFIF